VPADLLATPPADPAEIIQDRTDDNGDRQFYVHYLDCRCCQARCPPARAADPTPRIAGDRRLDEWVPLARISSLPPPSLLPQRLEKAPSLVPLASG
jgi:hypothetical protein